ncbi:hypothetical protein ACFFOV_05595 [Cerasicoccus arenae]
MLICLVCFASMAWAMSPEEITATLDRPQGLVLKNRAPLSGKAMGIIDGKLIFRSQRGGGTLDYRYALGEIERLQFPGNEVAFASNELLGAGQDEEALPLMRALYEQRKDYLALLTIGEQAYFARYAELEFKLGDPYAGLGAGLSLLPAIQDPQLKRTVDDLVLLGYYRLPLKQNTRQLANDWIANHEPYGPSALGYYVLGRMEFDQDNYESALWRTLEPVALSSQFPMDYLDYCYALAIAACVELENETEEQSLRQEMAQRGIAWPNIDDLAAYQEPAANPLKTEPTKP